jgi:hypothetical protein
VEILPIDSNNYSLSADVIFTAWKNQTIRKLRDSEGLKITGVVQDVQETPIIFGILRTGLEDGEDYEDQKINLLRRMIGGLGKQVL